MRCRVVLCDDHRAIRQALHEVVAGLPGFVVAAEAVDGPGLLDVLGLVGADLVVLDVGLPGGGPALAAQVRREHPGTAVVVFSAQADGDVQEAMLRAGAAEYVVKSGRSGPLRAALLRHGSDAAGPAAAS